MRNNPARTTPRHYLVLVHYLIAVAMTVTIWVPLAALYLIWEEAPTEVLWLLGSLAVNALLFWAFTKTAED